MANLVIRMKTMPCSYYGSFNVTLVSRLSFGIGRRFHVKGECMKVLVLLDFADESATNHHRSSKHESVSLLLNQFQIQAAPDLPSGLCLILLFLLLLLFLNDNLHLVIAKEHYLQTARILEAKIELFHRILSGLVLNVVRFLSITNSR